MTAPIHIRGKRFLVVGLGTSGLAAARLVVEQGAPVVHRLPGRAGWELRLVVQGGPRIFDEVVALQGASLHTRPRLHAWDWGVMLARALVM